MTREKCKEMLPLIQAFADGEHIEYWNNTEIVGTFKRGKWKTAENLGVGGHINLYRMIKNGQIHYFNDRPPHTDTLNKYNF